MKCFICDNYFTPSRFNKGNAFGTTCNDCNISAYHYDPDVEVELGILLSTGRVLPVFDDSDSDDSHGF